MLKSEDPLGACRGCPKACWLKWSCVLRGSVWCWVGCAHYEPLFPHNQRPPQPMNAEKTRKVFVWRRAKLLVCPAIFLHILSGQLVSGLRGPLGEEPSQKEMRQSEARVLPVGAVASEWLEPGAPTHMNVLVFGFHLWISTPMWLFLVSFKYISAWESPNKGKGFTVKQRQATDESTLPNQRLHSPPHPHTPLPQEKIINDLSLVITLAKLSEPQGSLICAHGSWWRRSKELRKALQDSVCKNLRGKDMCSDMYIKDALNFCSWGHGVMGPWALASVFGSNPCSAASFLCDLGSNLLKPQFSRL